MSQGFEERNVKRHRIKQYPDSLYITLDDKSIMSHRANESSWDKREQHTAMNIICRFASKMVGSGAFTWEEIAYQMESGTTGHHTVYDDIAKIIRDNGRT